MKITRASANARIGLLGNPSDGFFGKTISCILRNYSANAVVYEWPELEIILSRQDRCEFRQMEDLVDDVRINGLYGGLRLVKATIKVFAEYCWREKIRLPQQNFSLRYETDIPRQVGLGGSSAIITAAMRGLSEFYQVYIPREIMPGLVLSVETEEIGIEAGLQDRVCQVYEGLVYMDFNREVMDRLGHGFYESLDPGLLPPLYLAYRNDLGQVSGIYHNDLRGRWNRGEQTVHRAMKEFADLARMGRECLLRGDTVKLARLMDRNFDIRSGVSSLDPRNVEMIEMARSRGVSAKFAGSGGAIVGICESDETFLGLQEDFRTIGCTVIRPRIS
ncbi:MAG: GHMP kinase [Candidatus Aminicenantes bacterium]|nr:GHMP kinase [Candidatus Aminicenantes bacterium]